MGQKLLILVVGLLTLVKFAAADPTADAPCKVQNFTSLPGNLTLKGDNVTKCFKFNLMVTNMNIYLRVSPKVLADSDMSISVANVNASGGRYVVSSANVNNASSDYLVIGFGNKSVEVVINTTSVLLNNTKVMLIYLGNTTNACRFGVDSAPDQLLKPVYQPGVTHPFTCTYTYTPASGDNGVYAFTKFNFASKTSQLQVNLSGADMASFRGQDLPYDVMYMGAQFTVGMWVNPKTMDDFSAVKIAPTANCTKMVKVTQNGVSVTSPNYGKQNYANNLNCMVLLVSADNTRRLDIQLNDVHLANDLDRIQVVDGGASRAMINKSMALISALTMYRYPSDAALVSSGSAVLVWFRTDELGTDKGFSLTIKPASDLSSLYYPPSTIELAPKVNQTEDGKLVMLSPEKTMMVFTPGVLNSPTASIKCYDGQSVHSPLIASYKDTMSLYSAYSSDHRMLCVAKDFLANETFNATVKQATQSLTKLSRGVADVYSLDEPAAGNVTFNWIIQPDSTASTVIELTISQFNCPGSSVLIALSNMVALEGVPYASVTNQTKLPYRIRVPASAKLRMSVQVMSNSTTAKTLSLSASYKMANSSQIVIGTKGDITSPYFPLTTPAMTNYVWTFSVPANKSYQFCFDTLFELSNGSTLVISSAQPKKIFANVTGPSVAPSDIIFNNTMTNASMSVKVELMTKDQSLKTGVRISYALLDAGYSSALTGFPQQVRSANYPKVLNASTSSSWLFTVPKMNKAGLLERINVTFKFGSNTTAVLELRDGPHANSPPLTLNSSTSAQTSQNLQTSSNSLFVRYYYTAAVNKTGAGLLLLATADVCKNASQCVTEAGDTVCMPDSWRCNGVYECKDGKDEMNCGPISTTVAPGPGTTVAPGSSPWWTFFLCVIGGCVAGVLIAVIVSTVRARRSAGAYNRLGELAPVPT